MLRKELYKLRTKHYQKIGYQRFHYSEFDYSCLNKIMYIKKPMKTPVLVNDVIIMLDTETSKEQLNTVCENYVVAWTISIRAFHLNICTLYGNKPSECIECINLILDHLAGSVTYMYIFNLSFDWAYLQMVMGILHQSSVLS